MNPPDNWTPLELTSGQRAPTSVYYHGLEYPGEVVTTPSWEPQLGEPLHDDRFFRIVFLETYSPVDPQQLQDARIAVCIPPRSGHRRERALETERRVLREARARYAIPETEQALLEAQRQLYASGTVVARAELDIPAHAVFQEPHTDAWVSTMAQRLMAWTYPRLPLDSSAFPRPLGTNDAELLFRGLVQGNTAPEVVAAVVAFGPGLGLAPAEGHENRQIQECQVFKLIHSEMAQLGESWPCADLYQWMAHTQGLPYPLVSLYLLALLHRGHLLAELHLRPGHHLRLRGGGPYQGRVVVAETVSTLEFAPDLELESQMLRYATPASWNTLSLYFSALEPSLTSQEAVDTEAQTVQLMETLKTLQADVRRVRVAIEGLARALGEDMPQEASSLLHWFRRLSRARSPELALQTARQIFGSPEGLAQAATRYRALRQLADMAGLIARTAHYLREAHVPKELGALALQRETLLATLHMSELAGISFSPQVMEGQINRFRQEYHRAYAEHHDAFNHESASLLSQLRDARLEAQALECLNTIAELGEPVEGESLERFHHSLASITVCSIPASRLNLGRSPRCGRCGLQLGQQPPSQEIATVIRQVERGLKEQNQRLSLQVVHRILRGPKDEHIDRFIQVVQASDVSGLVNVLDQQLVAFLREVLSGP